MASLGVLRGRRDGQITDIARGVSLYLHGHTEHGCLYDRVVRGSGVAGPLAARDGGQICRPSEA